MTSQHSSPYDWVSPIYDPLIFAGREEETKAIMKDIERLVHNDKIHPIITIPGERRVGKTSLLHQPIHR